LEICVGCGKFICEECRERLERKVYCRRCIAEKQAGVEPGAPVGPGASARGVPGAPAEETTSRLAIASLVFSVAAVLVSVTMFVPKPTIMTAPAAGFIAFLGALMGGLGLKRIGQGEGSLRGRGLALSGLITGCLVLAGSIAFVSVFTMGEGASARGSARRAGTPAQGVPGRRGGTFLPLGRRQPPPLSTREIDADREATAGSLLDQAVELLNKGQLELAIKKCRAIVLLYPATETAKLVKDRLPLLKDTLAAQRAEAEALKSQNEEMAQKRFEHAVKMQSEGNRVTALQLFESVVEEFPETEAAEKARAETARNEKRIADENLQKLEAEASELASQAEQLLEAERYEEAAELYRKIANEYPQTPTSAATKSGLEKADLLARDPSEREFHRIEKELETKTYAETIASLQTFLGKFPANARAAEARELLKENQRAKQTADTLFNFGRAYFEDGKYEVALGRYRKLVKDYPRSRWISQAREKYEETIRKLEQ
jgi:TolA-binding protein